MFEVVLLAARRHASVVIAIARCLSKVSVRLDASGCFWRVISVISGRDILNAEKNLYLEN